MARIMAGGAGTSRSIHDAKLALRDLQRQSGDITAFAKARAALGLAGGVVATMFTLLPSFLLVLGDAALIEASRGRTGLAAPLAGIQAAVVGVIVHLALTFGHASFLPNERMDLFALLLAAIALWGVRRHGLGVVPLLLLCALAGLVRGVWVAS